MEPISMDREYTTRDGREVRIYAVDAGGDDPVHGAVKEFDSNVWSVREWKADGRYSLPVSCCDLIPKPRKHTVDVWMTAYRDTVTGLVWVASVTSETRQAALGRCPDGCEHAAIFKVTQEYVEGEGLSPPPGEGAKE